MYKRQALHAQLEAAIGERERFFALNEAFHLRLLELEGNRWRQQIVTDLRRVMKLNRHHSLFKQGRLAESLQEHRDLMQALVERRPEQVAQRMRLHFENGLNAAAPQAA